jgi:hypothetical protein
VRDIRSILDVTGPDLDRAFIEDRIDALGLRREWDHVSAVSSS